ncbi:MAG: F0F1 ATP synthase subunit B [Candidatus Cloacimonetes bacterium]|nr:F0F1 ATP synthase subunit B [Candidatus Cloacimonadota bacterium]
MVSIDYTLILVIVNFILLLIILKKLLYKPLMNYLAQREKQIKDDLDGAKQNKIDSEKLLESQKKTLQEARKEARELRDEVIKNAKISGEKIVQDAHAQKEVVVNEAQEIIQSEVKKAKRSIEKEIGRFVVSLTDKIIGKKFTKEQDLKLIDELIKSEMKEKKESKPVLRSSDSIGTKDES